MKVYIPLGKWQEVLHIDKQYEILQGPIFLMWINFNPTMET